MFSEIQGSFSSRMGEFKMRCEFCGETFSDSIDGLVEKTFHELIHEANNG
jgi:redox-regulated HSP33 family molecular chaperone